MAGTDRPDREAPEAIEFDLVEEFPEPPPMLNAVGAAFWNREGPRLVKAGVIQVVDLNAFTIVCYEWQMWTQKASAGISLTASEGNYLRGLFSDFCMSGPASRSKAAIGGEKPAGNKFATNGRRSA
ncbi:hypothetical protein [Pandoraea morbifera]|uniref:hypothetical protein n=1 Tax=Pandoraea morbifera TaxID=2508300 RepID=UPI001581FCDB|nr:hypothetical protein [Pandoraea morbifera]